MPGLRLKTRPFQVWMEGEKLSDHPVLFIIGHNQ